MSRFARVLCHRDFRYLFLAQAASVTGDRVVVVALALYITQRTGSATDLGVVLAAQSLPLIGLLLFGGVFADRIARNRIMVVTDLVRGSVHAVVAVLIFTGGAEIWQLIVLEALFGAAQAFFQPASTGLVPQTVPEDEIQAARALSETVSNLAYLIGPALATAIVLGLGAGEAFALDAASFAFSAWMTLRIRPRSRGEAVTAGTILTELHDGWREVRSRTWVWAVIAAFTVAVLCGYATWYSLAPSLARDHYGGAGVFGLLESCTGVGAVIGAVTGMRWRPRRPLYAGMVLGLMWPLQGLAFALLAPEALVAAMCIGTGFGFSLLMIWWETALAHHIPPAALSRVSAWDWMGSLALLPVGYVLAGPVAGALGTRLTLGAGSVIAFSVLLLALIPRSVRTLGGSAEHPLDDVAVAGGGEAEVPHVDPLVGVVHQRRTLQ